MKILVMGLPGAGKTWLSERLQKYLGSAWYNADKVREMANDWDFSPEGRVRQANRMKTFADYEKSHGRYVICDFVCPTRQTRDTFNPFSKYVKAESTDAEASSAFGDFLSNGFKVRSDGASYNTSGQTFIYMAFAEHPFVSSEGVPTTAR